MTGIISNSELKEELEVIIPNCKKLNIISAFVTQPATRWLSQLVKGNCTSVQLIGRFTPFDFIQGSSDLSALRDCITKGYKVKALTNLHAKIFQVDEDMIFNGSANLTGKGLALVNDCNIEACNRVKASSNSKDFINKIISSASELTLEIIDEMERYIRSIKDTCKPELQMTWPEHVLQQSTELFVSDFPFEKPDNFAREYELNPSLPFAQIENAKDDKELASALFKQSKAYRWLKAQVCNNLSDRDLGFGQISRLLHDALADDPAPYRKEVKGLQENLYSYLRLYGGDELEIYIPGRRSEVIRIKSD
ncbi:phospholipase D-like domain-containing protein [Photobacterium sanguinicancri]|uniref:phospholipase D-like domain-containing protein n=1 Tax=Photobacterium sanguinicancri TaxID=875932 RepID=UPI0024803779|nr:phospholipase D-like domain-containing protein [Photobacterium sanguinicancri]